MVRTLADVPSPSPARVNLEAPQHPALLRLVNKDPLRQRRPADVPEAHKQHARLARSRAGAHGVSPHVGVSDIGTFRRAAGAAPIVPARAHASSITPANRAARAAPPQCA